MAQASAVSQPVFRQEIVDQAAADLRALPNAGRYAALSSDPPWHHKSYSDKGQTRRSPSHHYRTMSIAEICALPVKEIMAPNSHCFLWTTQPHLELSFEVLKAWGYRYSSVFLFWVKLNPKAVDEMFLRESDIMKGMGKTTRKSVEILLLGRRGSPRRLHKGLGDIIISPRRQHSRKPDSAFSRIEAYCPGPRLDMFAREARPGFDRFGDEAAKFDAPAPVFLEPLGPPKPCPIAPLFEEAS